MKILFASIDNSYDVNAWSGLPYFMRTALERQGFDIVTSHDFQFKVPLGVRLRSLATRMTDRRIHNIQLEPPILRSLAATLKQQISTIRPNAVFTPLTGSPVAAYLDSDVPVISYGDATKYDWISTYNDPIDISPRSWEIIDEVDRQIFQRHRAVVLASDWARKQAEERYGDATVKTKVVPFGANLYDIPPVPDDHDTVGNDIRLLFIGKEWERKGGPIAVRLAEALFQRGYRVTLRVVGCVPAEFKDDAPPYVQIYGFIDKASTAGRADFEALLRDTDFLTMFPRAECYGLVFCEAAAYGVPVLATRVGGIPTIVEEGRTGQLFAPPVDLNSVASFVEQCHQSAEFHRGLRRGARSRFEQLLNWDVAGRALADILRDVVGRSPHRHQEI